MSAVKEGGNVKDDICQSARQFGGADSPVSAQAVRRMSMRVESMSMRVASRAAFVERKM